jgi:hypothetical protein
LAKPARKSVELLLLFPKSLYFRNSSIMTFGILKIQSLLLTFGINRSFLILCYFYIIIIIGGQQQDIRDEEEEKKNQLIDGFETF